MSSGITRGALLLRAISRSSDSMVNSGAGKAAPAAAVGLMLVMVMFSFSCGFRHRRRVHRGPIAVRLQDALADLLPQRLKLLGCHHAGLAELQHRVHGLHRSGGELERKRGARVDRSSSGQRDGRDGFGSLQGGLQCNLGGVNGAHFAVPFVGRVAWITPRRPRVVMAVVTCCVATVRFVGSGPEQIGVICASTWLIAATCAAFSLPALRSCTAVEKSDE